VCTVVCEWSADEAPRLLALRDEFVGRDFDEPGPWWPDQPTVIGGRDRLAGGSWCVSDYVTGTTALVLNRFEKRDGSPSRGVLPLTAVAQGTRWPDAIDVHGMASFNLALVDSSGVVVWEWDGLELRRLDLAPGLHVITSPGVDADYPRTRRFAPLFAAKPWLDVVTSAEPSGDDSALVVRRVVGDRTYATVFGQLITAVPGSVEIAYSRTPWVADSWQRQRWPG
jgi:hypothetical protein